MSGGERVSRDKCLFWWTGEAETSQGASLRVSFGDCDTQHSQRSRLSRFKGWRVVRVDQAAGGPCARAASLRRALTSNSMEPRPFSRGNSCQPRAHSAHGSSLQWSPDLSVAETPPQGAKGTTDLPSFNGAATFQSWKPLSALQQLTAEIPSMEPRPFSRGNSQALSSAAAAAVPSMEPRPFSRGNKHEHHPEDLSAPPSMEPRPFSRGNHARRARHPRGHRPSMEPRPFSRGNVYRPFGRRRRHYPFNGAATFQSRKRGAMIPGRRQRRVLQWSRDLSVAETALQLADDSGPGRPSMEPRPFSRGNDRVRRRFCAKLGLLQWSRDLSVAETAHYPTPTTSDSRLQWSRDLSVAETRRWPLGQPTSPSLQWSRDLSVAETRPRGAARPRCTPFNGAATFQSRKPPRSRRHCSTRSTFNGAATFQSRKLLDLDGHLETSFDLQWSRDLSVAETS